MSYSNYHIQNSYLNHRTTQLSALCDYCLLFISNTNMILLKPFHHNNQSTILSKLASQRLNITSDYITSSTEMMKCPRRKLLTIRHCTNGEEKRSFLTLEEAGLVEMSGLSSHEQFLCRLTISSLNLLRVVAEQEGCSIEELNAGKLCDWFLKDKLKKEQNLGTPVLQWEDSDFQL